MELSSSQEVASSDIDVVLHRGLDICKVKAPTRWVIPEATAKKHKKCVTSKPMEESVKYLDARRERKSGDKPKSVILAPDAAPRC